MENWLICAGAREVMVDICEVSYGIGAASPNKYIIKLCVNIFGVG